MENVEEEYREISINLSLQSISHLWGCIKFKKWLGNMNILRKEFNLARSLRDLLPS